MSQETRLTAEQEHTIECPDSLRRGEHARLLALPKSNAQSAADSHEEHVER
jgi:hypothetical protein